MIIFAREAERLRKVKEDLETGGGNKTCLKDNSGRTFRCYDAVNCCPGYAKIYDVSTPGVVQCRKKELATDRLTRKEYKICS